MALGFKVKKIKFDQAYTISELYEVIKDREFEAGKPELIKYLASTVIVFPALNSKNQVQIMAAGLKKQTQSYVVQKGDELSAGGAVKNLALNELTSGYSNLLGGFGGVVKECERLVDATHAELTSLHL